MRIRGLQVSNFSGIQSATLDFRPGLNVFYGPNELGKSSLVRAIRAALVLQDSSTAASPLIDWHSDAPPTVTLVFETEPQRIWRVRKSFGTGRDGWSYLEFSRDGQIFTQDAKGREVDGRLQELLRWGLEAPGGRGRKKRGIPDSFITTALLGEQSDVVEILTRNLDGDPDESGKQRLTEALQAMAEDPLFHVVLETTQSKVDEAFTATGRRKGGQNSPWVRLRDELQAARDRVAQVQEQLDESEAARIRIEGLQREILDAQVEAEQTVVNHRNVAADWEKQRARLETEQALAAAQTDVLRIQTLHDRVRETEEAIEQARQEAERLRTARDASREQVRAARANVEEARARVRDLESGAAEQQRRLREQEVENRLLGFAAREQELVGRVDQARRVGELSGREGELREDIANRQRTLEEDRRTLTTAQGTFARDKEEIGDLRQQLLFVRYAQARDTFRETGQALNHAQANQGEADRLQAEADAARREVESWHVPSTDLLKELRGLETSLQVAEEKLRVGITVALTAESDVEFEVSTDGEGRPASAIAGERSEFEAEGHLRLRIPTVGEFDVRGGGRDLHEAAKTCADRWNAASQPVFSETGCEHLAALEALEERARERLREAQDSETQATAARARAEGVDGFVRAHGDADADLQRVESALRESLPEGVTIDAFIAGLDGELPSSEAAVEEAIEELRGRSAERKDLATQLETQLSRDEGRLETLREEWAAQQREVEHAREGLTHDWQVVLEQSQGQLEDLRSQRIEYERELEAVRVAATTDVDDARRQLAAREGSLSEAESALEPAEQKSAEAQLAIARLEGELGVQREAVAREDASTAKALVEERETALSALPEPEQEVTDELREATERHTQVAKGEVRNLELRLRQAEGALEQVGGQYIEEQAEQAREAVAAAAEREREMDVDYGAWNLLRETLKEAESEDAVHLGNALVEPISQRMSALTGGRYGNLSLEPQLQASGIDLGGERREHASLSVGTQEQLATMLRLSIAEALGSFLVLDDQLTQSDPERMGWIRDLLRASAQEIQVVVFTCCPGDYLTTEEMGSAACDNDGARAVDLTRIMTRSLTQGTQVAGPLNPGTSDVAR